MKNLKPQRICVALFAALILLLYLLQVFAAAIPNAALTKQMRKSASYISNEKPYVFSEDGLFRNVTDNLADQMWLNIGWHMGTGNPFLSALDTRYYDGEEYGPPVGLYLSVTRGSEANTDYTRYWHGTAGILRLLHLFTDIQGIRLLGMACLVLLLSNTYAILREAGHWDLGLCLLLSLLLVQLWNLRLSAAYQPCFLICFLLCPAYLRLERRGDGWLEPLAVVSGTLTAFFDFLTTETVTLLIPLLLVVEVRSRERRLGSPRAVTRLLLRSLAWWLGAYLGTFVVKWVAVSLVTGENHVLPALISADQRIGGMVTYGREEKAPGMLQALFANLSVFFEGTSLRAYRQVFAGLTVAALLTAAVYALFRTHRRPRPGTGYLLALGAVALLRLAVLANHSYLHAFFTYRALAATLFGVLSALLLNLRPPVRGKEGTKWS